MISFRVIFRSFKPIHCRPNIENFLHEHLHFRKIYVINYYEHVLNRDKDKNYISIFVNVILNICVQYRSYHRQRASPRRYGLYRY